MNPFALTVVPIRIEDEMRNSYMDYSMSVIIGRALPDVRDGLKPVHRRILYAMRSEGLLASKKYSKCAGVVGEVLKKYHPHGDSAVYDSLVRMAQPWNLRYTLVDGQGNFGSVDGDPAAAYRYTECRMTRLAEEMLVDIEKETVSFSPNFDNSTEEPDVLPSRFPNLLVNGAEGIAVGMATKIPPHNLVEIVDACTAVIDNPDLSFTELLKIVPGPDFPTGGTIYGRSGIRSAYETGRGRVVVRGRAQVEEIRPGRDAIVIDEIPFQVNKARLIEQIAQLVRDKRLDGIAALRDESDRQGMRIVVELKREAYPEVVLNNLYKHTALQTTFGVILLAIVNQRPRILSLKEMIQHFIAHRREVILRRTRYDLRRAQERAHILEGYRIALDFIDEVIALIRSARTVDVARAGLMERFGLSEIQANAILEMRLQRLVGMERDKIEEEYAGVKSAIDRYEEILASEYELMGVVRGELAEIRDAYGDVRRTRIVDNEGELSMHDLVAEEDQVVTISHLGYIKRCSPDAWQTQRRGGMGKKGMATRDEDFVSTLFIANTHSQLLVFTTTGKVFGLEVYQVPEAKPAARGRPIVNLLNLPDEDKIAAVVSVRELDRDDVDLLFVSQKGVVKRTPLSAYKNLRQGGLIACGVAEDDALKIVQVMDPDDAIDIMLLSANGQSIRFPRGGAKGAPTYGRSARGNKGMSLSEDDVVVDAILVPASVEYDDETAEELLPDEIIDVAAPVGGDEDEDELPDVDDETSEEEPWETTLLTVTSLGFGKRTPFDAYPLQGRNGKGVIAHRTTDKTGALVGALQVHRSDQIMIVTDTGRIIRIDASSVRLVQGRASQGVRLMRLLDGECIVDVDRLAEVEDDEVDEAASLDAEGVDADVDAEMDEVEAAEPEDVDDPDSV